MRRIVLMVVVWGAVVVAASAVTWRVIDTAGRQILAEPYQPTSTSEGGEIGSPAVTMRPEPTKKPSKKPSAKQSKPATQKPGPTPSGPTSAPTPAVSPVVRAWKGAAGTLEASCTGSKITWQVTPNDGYRAEVEPQGPSAVAVHFEPKSDAGSEATVTAQCVSGVPQFQVQSESSG